MGGWGGGIEIESLITTETGRQSSRKEEAIRFLSASERNKLLHDISDLFPELSGDAEWERIIADERPRRALTELLDETEAEFRRNPDGFPELTERDFSSPS